MSIAKSQTPILGPHLFHGGAYELHGFIKEYLEIERCEIGLSATGPNLLTNFHYCHSLVPTLSLRHGIWKQASHTGFWASDKEDRKGTMPDILVMPVRYNTRIIGFLEIICCRSEMDHVRNKLKPLQDDLAQAFQMYLLQMKNNLLEKFASEFSTFHSSVHWKFLDCMAKSMNGIKDPGCQRIEFKGVQAFFAQSDVIRSTEHRNKAVQSDLVSQCQEASKLLDRYAQNSDLPLLLEVQRDLWILQRRLLGPFDSQLEFEANQLFVDRLHPILLELQGNGEEIKASIRSYLMKTDEDDGLFFANRYAYEQSIELINNAISEVLNSRAEAAQRIVPHYFQKHTTDGISFQLFAGQSLLRTEKFSQVHLDNLHLWLLLTLCDITRAVEKIKDELPLKMKTAQLIIAYNRPINLAYRKDEKCLDVEHGRHVRYETLKKRFDKSMVLGTRERLTKTGHLAIVYTYETERWSYLKHFKYLHSRGLIAREVEDLPLAPMQGIRGVRALRVPVLF